VVIQITPHTEQAPTSSAASPGIPGAQEAHKAKSAQSKENKIGVFAKLLAGLSGRSPLHKTGTGEGAKGAEIPGKLPLAETAESGGKGKNTRAGKISAAAELAGAKKPSRGATETGLPHNELSEQEKNILLSVGLLANQGEEQVFSGKARGERAVKNTADLSRSSGESVKTETLFAALTEGKEALSPGKQSLTANFAVSAGETAGKTAKTAADKAKNRSSAENGANSGLIAGESLRIEAKKPSRQEGIGRAEELRKERRRGAAFEVRDFRSVPAAANVSVRAGGEARVETAGKDIVLELRLPNQGQDSSQARTTWEVKAGQAFEDLLARELHQNFNNDIVRHASVMLRDGNEGTIRLALKPESLGNVKIRPEMAENKITGFIVVESEEALRAFEREIASLEKAFLDSGFDGADLEMSLAADGREAQQQWQGTEASRTLPWQFAASRYDAAIEQMEMPLTLDLYTQGARAINMLA
jgi:hypothetical protein